MAIIDTLFMTKTAENIPFGAAHTYVANIREYPPGINRPHDARKSDLMAATSWISLRLIGHDAVGVHNMAFSARTLVQLCCEW